MRTTVTSVGAIAIAVVVCINAAGFGQLQQKTKGKSDKSTPPGKTAKDPSKHEANKTPASDGKTAAATAKDANKREPAEKAAGQIDDAGEAEIRQGAEAFVAAYNAHDPKAVSELFALRAEFTDEDGNLIQGREAIEQDFATMFAENPQCTIELEVHSIRLLTPNIAIEEGVVLGQPTPEEDVNVSSYIAVHVKVEGRWLIGSVSEVAAESKDLTANDHLQQLAWMEGDWIDESPDAVVKTTCRWDDSGNYILHDFTVQIAGAMMAGGSMRIGWDPLTRQIKSWTFNSDSGHSEGLWSQVGDEWVVKAQGASSAGEVTAATHVFRRVDDDTMTWRSYDRITGGLPEEDIPEYVIKRQAPAPLE